MKRMNPKARRYLLTFRPESPSFGYEAMPNVFVGGRWAIQQSPVGDVPTVHHFSTPEGRIWWMRLNPRRRPVGKRHPLVKAHRQRLEKEVRQERDREKLRDAAYTAWMWESP